MMNTKMKHNRQHGATLVVALIILLVMSVVGVATMRSSTLQERMAGNNRQKMLSFNAAEFALRQAEADLGAWLENSSQLANFNGTDGKYAEIRPSAFVGAIAPLGTKSDITDVTKASLWRKTASDSVEVAEYTAGAAHKPRYVIELIGQGSLNDTGTQLTNLNADAVEEVAPYFFRITAIGWSKDANIYSVLESIYRTGDGSTFAY